MDIKTEILKEVFENSHGNKVIALENSRLDFNQEMIFLGFTKTGNLKLGEVHSSGPQGQKWNNKRGKVTVSDNEIEISVDRFEYSKTIKVA